MFPYTGEAPNTGAGNEFSEGTTVSAALTSSCEEEFDYVGVQTCFKLHEDAMQESSFSDSSSQPATPMAEWPSSDSEHANSIYGALEGQQDIITAFEGCTPIVSKVGAFLQALKVRHNVSNKAIQIIYEFFVRDNNEEIRDAVVQEQFPSIWTMRKKADKTIPPTLMSYKYVDEDGIRKTSANHQKVPRRLFVDRDKLLQLCAHNRLQDLFRHHWKLHHETECPGLHGQRIEISSDGVKETNVAKRRLHIVSVTFEGCKQPMPW